MDARERREAQRRLDHVAKLYDGSSYRALVPRRNSSVKVYRDIADRDFSELERLETLLLEDALKKLPEIATFRDGLIAKVQEWEAKDDELAADVHTELLTLLVSLNHTLVEMVIE